MLDLQNLTPTPFIRVFLGPFDLTIMGKILSPTNFFLDSGPDVLLDLDGQTKEEIHERIGQVLGKTE